MRRRHIPRWVFRLQHRLSMTHEEFMAVTLAVLLLLGGELARHFVAHRPAFDREAYRTEDSLFQAIALAKPRPDTTRFTRRDSTAGVDTVEVRKTVDSSAVADKRLDVNRATIVDLTRLPGIGPRLAERIVDYRRQHGPFRRVEDLEFVTGIGPRKLEKLAPLVVAGF